MAEIVSPMRPGGAENGYKNRNNILDHLRVMAESTRAARGSPRGLFLLKRDEAVANRVANQAGHIVDIQFVHQPHAVSSRGFNADPQQYCDFLA